jgi:pimeloyl-ACP methyl ester carboxylesterase
MKLLAAPPDRISRMLPVSPMPTTHSLTLIPNAGHELFLDQPKAFLDGC